MHVSYDEAKGKPILPANSNTAPYDEPGDYTSRLAYQIRLNVQANERLKELERRLERCQGIVDHFVDGFGAAIPAVTYQSLFGDLRSSNLEKLSDIHPMPAPEKLADLNNAPESSAGTPQNPQAAGSRYLTCVCMACGTSGFSSSDLKGVCQSCIRIVRNALGEGTIPPLYCWTPILSGLPEKNVSIVLVSDATRKMATSFLSSDMTDPRMRDVLKRRYISMGYTHYYVLPEVKLNDQASKSLDAFYKSIDASNLDADLLHKVEKAYLTGFDNGRQHDESSDGY